MLINRYYQLAIVTALLLILSACGFHLRGEQSVYLDNINLSLKIQAENKQFEKIFTRDLQLSRVKLISANQQTQQDKDNWQLTISRIEFISQGSSRDVFGRANEVKETLQLDFTLQKTNRQQTETDQQEIVPEEKMQSISQAAYYFQSSLDFSGEKARQKETRELLMQKISQQLMRMIEYQVKG